MAWGSFVLDFKKILDDFKMFLKSFGTEVFERFWD
jgi:hypothetical protein